MDTRRFDGSSHVCIYTDSGDNWRLLKHDDANRGQDEQELKDIKILEVQRRSQCLRQLIQWKTLPHLSRKSLIV